LNEPKNYKKISPGTFLENFFHPSLAKTYYTFHKNKQRKEGHLKQGKSYLKFFN